MRWPRELIALWAAVLMIPATAFARGEPLPWGEKRASTHAPYGEGMCSACHDRKGPNPGPPPDTSDGMCFSCHEELKQHAHAFKNCLKCHNAHDSTRPKLLNADIGDCPSCHRW